jgi:hypothetical protein
MLFRNGFQVEKKLAVTTKGYDKVAMREMQSIVAAHGKLFKSSVKLQCYRELAVTEGATLPQRTHELYDLSKDQAERNCGLQDTYAALIGERDAIFARLNQE